MFYSDHTIFAKLCKEGLVCVYVDLSFSQIDKNTVKEKYIIPLYKNKSAKELAVYIAKTKEYLTPSVS